MTKEQPTHEEASTMVKAILLGLDTHLAAKFPETWEELQDEVEALEDEGLIVDGYAL